jgi:hypothetical protein
MERSAMEENNMTDDDRKVLTEFLGQCAFLKADNRTFTTPDDMMAVKDKLVEKGLWDDLINYTWTSWDGKYSDGWRMSWFIDWLINPTRFCQLACQFIRDDMFQLLEDRDKEN